MNRLWIRARLPLAIFGVLLVAVVMARLFSGPEDAWVRNKSGEWVSHGVPSGVPPEGGVHDSSIHLVVPAAFLVSFAGPLVLLGLFRARDRLTYSAMVGDQRLFGYLGISFAVFGVLTGLGLCGEILVAAGSSAGLDDLSIVVFGALTGFALFSCIIGVLFFVLKRLTGDHYLLMKSQREIVEKLAVMIQHPSA